MSKNAVITMRPAAPDKTLSTYAPAQLDLIKRTVAKDLNADEFDMYIAVCRRVGLDPFRKQIYANVYNKDKPDRRQVVFITSIDGFRAIAARNGDYRPDEDEPEIAYDESLKGDDNPKGIEKAVVTVWKLDPTGEWRRIKGIARWEEFAPLQEEVDWVDTGEVWADSGKPKMTKKPTGKFALDPNNSNSFWRRMPAHMLAKCAEAQALRKGWPEDLSGIYAPEEMAHADLEERSASELVEEEREQQRLARVAVAHSITFGMEPGAALEPIPLGQLHDRCAEYIRKAESPTELEAWKQRNRYGLQEFWARDPNAALDIKRQLETKLRQLDAPQKDPAA